MRGASTFLSGDKADLDEAGELLEEGDKHALARLVWEVLDEEHPVCGEIR